MCFGSFVHYFLPYFNFWSHFYLCISRPDVGAKREFVDADRPSVAAAIFGVFNRCVNLANVANSLISLSVNSIYPQVT